MATERPPLPDDADRAQAVRERARNVLVDAGAGTGKTTLVIDRVVDMVAPEGPAVAPLPLARLAVITFTRRAAGELRYRLRQKLLAALRDTAEPRAAHLREALGVVDTAYIGTIHSFADRLLRLRPVEAEISPSYDIAEDTEELVRAVFDRLLHGATTGQLGELLGGRDPGPVPLAEVEETVRLFVAAGLRTETRYGDDWILAGLDLLVAGMIDTRDIGYVPELVEPDLAAVRALAADVAAQLKGVPGSTSGGRFLRDVAARCREVTATDSPAEAFRILRETLRSREFKRNKRDDFEGQQGPWKVYTTLRDAWRGQLVTPLSAWMGARLARLRFVVAKLYEEVKAERAVLDQLDLLVKLRDVLRDRALVRRQLQALFDHVFVDEFQDTDPLQCEVVFFLCEAGAKADEWRRVQLRPGSLTVVGDPKQSIYRFRRADIAMYEEAHRQIREQGAFVARLVTNFRSRPPLIHFANPPARPSTLYRSAATTART